MFSTYLTVDFVLLRGGSPKHSFRLLLLRLPSQTLEPTVAPLVKLMLMEPVSRCATNEQRGRTATRVWGRNAETGRGAAEQPGRGPPATKISSSWWIPERRGRLGTNCSRAATLWQRSWVSLWTVHTRAIRFWRTQRLLCFAWRYIHVTKQSFVLCMSVPSQRGLHVPKAKGLD